MQTWFACFVSVEALGREMFNGRVFAVDEAEAMVKYRALVPNGPVRFQADPKWEAK